MSPYALLLLLCVPVAPSHLSSRLTYRLTGDSIAWPSRAARHAYTTSGRYVPRNILPTRFQMKGLQAVLVFPRMRPGVPITLGKVQLKLNRCTPEVEAFPSWELQAEGSDKAIQNAVDLVLDQNNILWVLDTGIVNTMEMPTRRGAAKIWGIHFRTGKVEQVIDISSLTNSNSRLQHITTDFTEQGQILLVSDTATSAVLVWNLSTSKGYNLNLPITKTQNLPIFVIRRKKEDNLLVFPNLHRLLGVKIKDLVIGKISRLEDFGEKPPGIVFLGTDNTSVLFFRYRGDARLYGCDLGAGGRFSDASLVQSGVDTCRFCTQVTGGCRGMMWAMDSNFQDFVNGVIGSVGASVCIHPLQKTNALRM